MYSMALRDVSKPDYYFSIHVVDGPFSEPVFFGEKQTSILTNSIIVDDVYTLPG